MGRGGWSCDLEADYVKVATEEEIVAFLSSAEGTMLEIASALDSGILPVRKALNNLKSRGVVEAIWDGSREIWRRV